MKAYVRVEVYLHYFLTAAVSCDTFAQSLCCPGWQQCCSHRESKASKRAVAVTKF